MIKRLIPVYLLLTVFPLMSEEVFRSNSIGMTLEKISPYREDNFEYVLRVNNDLPDTLVKILLKNGKEYKRWIEEDMPEGRKVTLLEEERKTEETFFSEDNRIQRIVRYNGEEEIAEELIHYYADGELDYVVAGDGEGNELYRILYIQGKYGRLRKMEKIYPEKVSESRYTFGRDSVSAEWHGRDTGGDLFRFEKDQQLSALETWEGLQKNSKTEYEYKQGTVEQSTSVDYLSNIVTKTWYNDKGLQQRVLSEREGVLKEETEYEYNESGDVKEKRVWTPGTREKWEYTYTTLGEPGEEFYYKNGVLVSKTEYIDDSTYYEYLYRRGEPFIKLTYIDDVEVDEALMIGTAGDGNETR